MTLQNEEHENTETPGAQSYKTMLKNYLNSLSEETCKNCCDVANLLVPGSIPEDETTTFKEKITGTYDNHSEEHCKTILTLAQKFEKNEPDSEKLFEEFFHSVIVPLYKLTHQYEENKEDEEDEEENESEEDESEENESEEDKSE